MTAASATFVIAALLAQISPAAATIVAQAPSSAPQPLATPSPSADDLTVRRGPQSAPRMAPPGDPAAVTIRNSGSTNSAGYTVVVHADRSADVVVGDARERRTVGAPQVRWLFLKVRAASPLDALPGGGCMKSASFGSTTTIAYDGHVSPDLSCGEDPASRELLRTANVIVDRLDIDTRPLRARGRLPG